jgi:hypothetical protein
MMHKTVVVFATMALIIALIEIWIRSAVVATQSVTAAEIRPSGAAISSSELTLKSAKSLPDGYRGGDYMHVYLNR